MIRHLGIRTDLDVLEPLLSWGGKQVVDVGCGPGHLCRGLADLGATVRGFEPDPVQAERNRQAEPHERVTFDEAGAQDLPIPTNSADVVLLSRSLHHVPDNQMDAALQQADRVLRPGGLLVVIEPDIHGQFSQLIRPFHDETTCRAQALQAMDRAEAQFASMEELWFTNVVRFDTFAAFRARMVSMSFNDIVAQRIDCPEVHASFAAGQDGDGFRFTNPMRVRQYRSRSG